jgi:phospholipid transport system transporter-binding protein
MAHLTLANIAQTDNRWNISGDVVIGTVPSLLLASKALPIGANTMIDFANVTDIDTSTISLILEWKRRAKKENQPIKFVNLPANLNSLTQLYGVAELIN